MSLFTAITRSGVPFIYSFNRSLHTSSLSMASKRVEAFLIERTSKACPWTGSKNKSFTIVVPENNLSISCETPPGGAAFKISKIGKPVQLLPCDVDHEKSTTVETTEAAQMDGWDIEELERSSRHFERLKEEQRKINERVEIAANILNYHCRVVSSHFKKDPLGPVFEKEREFWIRETEESWEIRNRQEDYFNGVD